MTILISISVTLVVIIVGIELANCIAYGFFAGSRQVPHIYNELSDGQLSPFDFEIISGQYGFISIVPLSIFSTYYYSSDDGRQYRVIRFTKLHREIEAKFKQLQTV